MNSIPAKRIAIVQSCYIPWKGYFDIIHDVDTFVLYDTCQFTRRDWRTRNKIKTPQGSIFLSVPVKSKGNFTAPINAIEVADHIWVDKHLASMRHNYARASHFRDVWPVVEALYEVCRAERLLSRINYLFIKGICDLLKVEVHLVNAPDECASSDPSAKLVEICMAHGATEYLSGQAAKSYLNEELFTSHGIQVTWVSYGPYPEYPQLYPPFDHNVTVLDVLFNVGLADAGAYIFALDADVTRSDETRP